MFFFLAMTLILYKWGLIIQRVYVCSGNFSLKRYQIQKRIGFGLATFFILIGAVTHFTIMLNDLKNNNKMASKQIYGPPSDIDMPPSYAQNIVIGVYFSVLFISFFGFGLFLFFKLKQYFQQEYVTHARSILWAILLEFFSIIFMFSQMTILKMEHN